MLMIPLCKSTSEASSILASLARMPLLYRRRKNDAVRTLYPERKYFFPAGSNSYLHKKIISKYRCCTGGGRKQETPSLYSVPVYFFLLDCDDRKPGKNLYRRFDRYCSQSHPAVPGITQEMVDGWCRRFPNETNNSEMCVQAPGL